MYIYIYTYENTNVYILYINMYALTLHISELSFAILLIDPRETPKEGGALPMWVESGFEATGERVLTSDAEMPAMVRPLSLSHTHTHSLTNAHTLSLSLSLYI